MSTLQSDEEIPIVRERPLVNHHEEDPDDRIPPAHVQEHRLYIPSAEDRRPTDRFDTADQFTLLTSYFDEKFGSMERRLAAPVPEINSAPYVYKGKSNKIQGEFNATLKNLVTEAKSLLASGGGHAVKRSIALLDDVDERLGKRLEKGLSTRWQVWLLYFVFAFAPYGEHTKCGYSHCR